MKHWIEKKKKLEFAFPLLLLIVQQLCLCLLICNFFHEHNEDVTPAALLQMASAEVKAAHAPDGCAESQHLEKCTREKLSRATDIKDFVALEAPLPVELAVSNDLPIPCSVKQKPDLSEKVFLKLRTLRC